MIYNQIVTWTAFAILAMFLLLFDAKKMTRRSRPSIISKSKRMHFLRRKRALWNALVFFLFAISSYSRCEKSSYFYILLYRKCVRSTFTWRLRLAKFSKNTGMNAKVGNTLKSNPMFSLKEKSGTNSVEILPQIIGLLKKNIPPRYECQLLSFLAVQDSSIGDIVSD